MLTIDEATPDDAADLAARLSAEDAAEMDAAGLNVAECLAGVQAQAMRWHGRLVCLFGVVRHPESVSGGIPWMLCTDTLSEVPSRAMAAISAQVVAVWRGEFTHLSNLVHRHNRGALRFLRWLGFSIGHVPCGPGQAFFVFEWSKACATR